MTEAKAKTARRARGFEPASGLIARDLRKAGEGRGFAVARVLTQWAEIVGQELAGLARPVKVSYARDGLEATLTLLTSGAAAPLVQMRAGEIRDKVNACYGYAAIARLRITQTAAAGFAESPAGFAHAEKPPDPAADAAASAAAEGVADPALRAALERLGQNVMHKT